MKKISIDSNSILDTSTKKTMSQVIDFNKEYVTTETDKDTVYKAGDGINISSDNTISIDKGDSAAVEPADTTTAGIMKLYGETGANSDGTMTQESITDELDNKAPTDSPEFTGTPTAPTPDSSDTGSDRIATTAYVLNLLKNKPGIIDEILTALGDKADKTALGNKADKTAGNSLTLGLTKLYSAMGQNTDGAVTQKQLWHSPANIPGSYFSVSSYPSMGNGYEGWYLAGGDAGLFAGNPSSNYAGLKYVNGGIALIGYQAKTKTEKASVAVDGGGGVNIKGAVRITGDLYVNGTKIG